MRGRYLWSRIGNASVTHRQRFGHAKATLHPPRNSLILYAYFSPTIYGGLLSYRDPRDAGLTRVRGSPNKNLISLVDAHSFWVDGYFEESNLTAIHQADPATIKLMGYPQTLRGHVNSGARAITVADAQPDQVELASVNPIFTLMRLRYRWGAKRRDPLCWDDSDPADGYLALRLAK
jgi:hypothetical protein